MIKPNLEKRLEFILGDLNNIEECLEEKDVDIENIYCEKYDEPLINLFKNIRIACDLKDDEPETSWE